MSKLGAFVSLLICTACAPGCGTIQSQGMFWDHESPGIYLPYVYGGVAVDVVWVATGGADLGRAWMVYHALDLPLSFAADTVLLPLTIPQEILRRLPPIDRDPEPE